MKVLVVLADPPYGTERCYNGLRLAHALAKRTDHVVAFLVADAVEGARRGQKTPDGYFNIERMLKRMLAGNGQVLLCGTCMDVRCLLDADLVEGTRRSTMDELATLTAESDKVIVF